MSAKDDEYSVYVCACGSRDLSLTDGPWLSPMIMCNKCGVFAAGNTREDVIKRWNKCVEMDLRYRERKVAV